MAAVGILDAIGLLSGVLGIVQFGIDNVPKAESVGSTVRVTVGLDMKGGLNNAGGDLPDIRLFNEVGEFLGIVADPGKVKSGSFGDITVKHNDNSGQQATYALFSANNDAICIAYTSITWPSGEKYAWIGDWGHKCGGSWYYSNVYIAASGQTPDCLWIDGNNDQPQTGFQVHWPEFVSSADNKVPQSMADKDAEVHRLCTAGPPFKMHTYPDKDPRSITYWIPNHKRSTPDKRDAATAIAYGPPKHAASARFRALENQARSNNQTSTLPPMMSSLVIGSSEKHSAEGLCGSETSFGPDFLNTQTGMFCRMSDKTTWPVCDGGAIIDNCFNNNLNQLVINGFATRDEPYKNIIDWTSGNSHYI
ncbi:hypothetical protein ONZ43_g6215 [Nemania bipapillata]|uniref:Uncharacterized protein n=1 Tax=Nemania bipapillata TaxID=110536 RepID=A0ACC2I1Y0_9PEZI|nr:hypothetical protein ONZ43_g6215 [Nemania bipapillata]